MCVSCEPSQEELIVWAAQSRRLLRLPDSNTHCWVLQSGLDRQGPGDSKMTRTSDLTSPDLCQSVHPPTDPPSTLYLSQLAAGFERHLGATESHSV